MAVKNINEIMESVKARIGEDTSDEALAFIEDITDTLNDFNTRVSEAGDWKRKYEENDSSWRQKYQERFFQGTPDDTIITDPEPEPEPKAPTTFEELFKTK